MTGQLAVWHGKVRSISSAFGFSPTVHNSLLAPVRRFFTLKGFKIPWETYQISWHSSAKIVARALVASRKPLWINYSVDVYPNHPHGQEPIHTSQSQRLRSSNSLAGRVNNGRTLQ